MSKNKVFGFSALSVAIAMSLYACGGGGSSGGDSTPPPVQHVTLSGKVSVPALTTASLQKGWGGKLLDFLISPSFAELTGMTALAGATVSIVELDAMGNPTANVIATTSTNTLGEYSFTHSAIKPNARYIIKVSKSGIEMRAPLYSQHVNVDPGTEAVIQQVLAQLDGITFTLDNFTLGELNGLVAMVANSGIDLGSVATVNDAITAIVNDITLTLGAKAAEMKYSGHNSAATLLGGGYNYIHKAGGFDLAGSSLTTWNMAGGHNSSALNSGLLTYSETADKHRLILSFTQMGPTVSTSSLAPSTEVGTLPYYETAAHQLYADNFIGATTPDGEQYILAKADTDLDSTEHVFQFAGRHPASIPALSGRTFHFIGMHHYMEGDLFDVEIYRGTFTYAGASGASSSLTSNILGVSFLSGAVSEGTWSAPFAETDITYSVEGTGALTMSSPTHGAGFLKGFVSGTPGNYIGGFIADAGVHNAQNGIIMLEKVDPATPASTATLSGTYNKFTSCTRLYSVASYPGAKLYTSSGVITFDGAGNFTSSNATVHMSTFTTTGISGSTTSSNTSSLPMPYTVAADGTLTITGSNAVGATTANGNVYAITDYVRGERCMTIGLKQ